MGTGLYTLDDLPDRIREGKRLPAVAAVLAERPGVRVRIEGVGTVADDPSAPRSAVTLARLVLESDGVPFKHRAAYAEMAPRAIQRRAVGRRYWFNLA